MELTHLDKETTDGTVRNLDALYQLFPSCFTEAPDALGKVHRAVDWGKLRSLLGEYVEDGEPEKYDFTWVGKRAAQREAAAPCRKTLRPCKEESVDWDTTQNLYIEGDNLEVLKLLQNSYMGKVKMIYIDPPYNTGNDFVYHDDFDKDYSEYDEHNKFDDGTRFWRNTDCNGRFHSDWCSMIYSRLMVARSLLTDDGVIFISIDDNEVENLKKLCNEIFGESNFIAQICRATGTTTAQGTNSMGKSFDYALMYSKGYEYMVGGIELSDKDAARYDLEDEKGKFSILQLRRTGGEDRREDRPSMYYGIETPDGKIVYPKGPTGYDSRWRVGEDTYKQMLKDNLIYFKEIGNGYGVYYKFYLEGRTKRPSNLWTDIEGNKKASIDLKALIPEKVFETPKPIELITRMMQIAQVKNSIILDFFSGSATTAHAVMQLNAEDGGNRKYIMVQLPEETAEDSEAYKAGYKNICEIGKERIRRAGKKIKADSPLTTQDLDIGFRVLKCDESNYKSVAFAPKDYTQESLDMFLDNIKEERTGLDLLFDCMMRWGLELSLPYETQKVDGCTIYNVDDGNLVACFDGVVTSAVIDAIADTHPLRVVFRDSSFTEAAQKMNLFELFKQKCGWTDQEVQNNVRVI